MNQLDLCYYWLQDAVQEYISNLTTVWGSGKVLNTWKKIWHQICWSEISEKFWKVSDFRNSELFRCLDLWSGFFQMFRVFVKLLMLGYSFVPTTQQAADLLTKPLTTPNMREFYHILGFGESEGSQWFAEMHNQGGVLILNVCASLIVLLNVFWVIASAGSLSRFVTWLVAVVFSCFSLFAFFVYLKFSCPLSFLFSH